MVRVSHKERIRNFIEHNYRPGEVFDKWGVMKHFDLLHGKEHKAQPTTERRMRELAAEDFLKHPADLISDTESLYYYEGGNQ